MITYCYYKTHKEMAPGPVTDDYKTFLVEIQELAARNEVFRLVIEPGDATHYDFIIIVQPRFVGVVKRSGTDIWYVECGNPPYTTVAEMGEQIGHTGRAYTCHVIASLLGHMFGVEWLKAHFDWESGHIDVGGS